MIIVQSTVAHQSVVEAAHPYRLSYNIIEQSRIKYVRFILCRHFNMCDFRIFLVIVYSGITGHLICILRQKDHRFPGRNIELITRVDWRKCSLYFLHRSQ